MAVNGGGGLEGEVGKGWKKGDGAWLVCKTNKKYKIKKFLKKTIALDWFVGRIGEVWRNVLKNKKRSRWLYVEFNGEFWGVFQKTKALTGMWTVNAYY